MKEQLIAFARLTKIDEEKRLVFGRAAQEVPDRGNELLDYDKSKPYFEQWSKSQLEASMGKSAGNIRLMHGKDAAGIIIPGGLTFNDSEKAVDICVKVVDDAVWKKVEAGALTGFSIGGKYVAKSQPDPKTGVVTYVGDISEISLVDRPAVPTATFFEVQKADGKVEKREFAKPVMIKIVRRDGADLGKTIDSRDLPQPGEEFAVGELRYSLFKVEGDSAFVDEVYDLNGTPDELNAFAKLMNERKLTIATATALLAKGAPAPAPEVKDDNPEMLGKAAQIAQDRDKVDFKKLEATDPKRAEYIALAKADMTKEAGAAGDPAKPAVKAEKVFADPENRRFPLDTEPQIVAAWAYAHVAKGYEKDKRDAILKAISAAAKEKSIELPTVEKLAKAAEIIVPLAAEFAALTTEMAKAAGKEPKDVEHEARVQLLVKRFAGDSIAKFNAEEVKKRFDEELAKDVTEARNKALQKGLWTCSDFAGLLNSLVNLCSSVEYEAEMENDASDIPARLYVAIGMLGDILVDMVREEVSEATGSPALEQMQKVAAILTKAKETHKAVSTRAIQKMHDNTVKMGAACGNQTSNAIASAAVLEASDAAALQKAADGGDALAKALLASNTALASATEALNKANLSIAEQGKRIQKLELQPMPPRVAVRAVSKDADVGSGVVVTDPALARATQYAASIKPVMKADGVTIDEAATAVKIMRATGGVPVLDK